MLFSIYAWSVILIVVGAFMPMMIVAMTLRLPRSWIWAAGRVVYRTAFFLIGVRIKTQGIEALDKNAPMIFMCNHVSLLDPFIFCCAFKKPIVGVEKRENFKIPMYGWLMKKWGMIPIERKDVVQARKDLQKAAETLREDRAWVVMLPEGTRTANGELGPFKKGAAHLAIDTKIDVCAFTQHNAYRVKNKNSWKIRPGTIDIDVHTPVDPREFEPGTLTNKIREDILERLRLGPKRLESRTEKQISA